MRVMRSWLVYDLKNRFLRKVDINACKNVSCNINSWCLVPALFSLCYFKL